MSLFLCPDGSRFLFPLLSSSKHHLGLEGPNQVAFLPSAPSLCPKWASALKMLLFSFPMEWGQLDPLRVPRAALLERLESLQTSLEVLASSHYSAAGNPSLFRVFWVIGPSPPKIEVSELTLLDSSTRRKREKDHVKERTTVFLETGYDSCFSHH